VVEVMHGRDDDIGREVIATRNLWAASWEEWVEETLRALEGRVRIVVDRRGE